MAIKKEIMLGNIIIEQLNVGERALITCPERGGRLHTSRVVDWYRGYPAADNEVVIETEHTIYIGYILEPMLRLVK